MAIKPTKRALHTEEVKKNILEAAENLFRQYGYDTVSMKDIAEAVGATTGTLYHHFENKEDILRNIPNLTNETINAQAERYQESTHPLDDLMDFYVNVMVDRVIEDGKTFTEYRVLHVMKMDQDGVVGSITKTLVARAQQLGQLRTDRSVDELADFFTSIFRGANYYYVVGPEDIDLKKMVESRLKLAIEGVKPVKK